MWEWCAKPGKRAQTVANCFETCGFTEDEKGVGEEVQIQGVVTGTCIAGQTCGPIKTFDNAMDRILAENVSRKKTTDSF